MVVFFVVCLVAVAMWAHDHRPGPLPAPTAATATTEAGLPAVVWSPLVEPAQARAELVGLPVSGLAVPGYRRDAFGKAWADVDDNGCSTREDVLRRDLTNVRTSSGVRPCEVVSGHLHDPYTGMDIDFIRGVDTSDAVQVDHVWSLSAAWSAGAHAWTTEQRTAFANDPANLLAVDGPTNNSKSDKGPAAWMPPNRAYTCQFAVRWTHVAHTWGLSTTAADKKAIEKGLSTCPA